MPRLENIKLPGESNETPMQCKLCFHEVILICAKKSKVADAQIRRALDVYGRHIVGDRRLREENEANEEAAPREARTFVLGAEEALRQEEQAPKKCSTWGAASTEVRRYDRLDLVEFERNCLEDDSVDVEMARRRLEKAAMTRQLRESAGQQMALVKKRRVSDFERYEAESKAVVDRIQAERDKIALERDRIQGEREVERDRTALERAKLSAERRAVEEDAHAASEERERQRLHVAELAAERRKAEIRKAAEKGEIHRDSAAELLGESRQTPILRLEQWLGRACRCPAPSRCSSELGKLFKEAVAGGRHGKPASHFDAATQRWKLFAEHDGAVLVALHQEIHDRRDGLRPGQARLCFGLSSGSSSSGGASNNESRAGIVGTPSMTAAFASDTAAAAAAAAAAAHAAV